MLSVLQEAQRPALDQVVSEEPGEFEIVMGRGQLASTMLLVLVLLVVFSAGAYVIGKSAGPRVVAPTAAPAQVALAASAPVQSAPVAVEKPAAQEAGKTAPVYGDQVAGKVYLQVGAVERGLAGIWAEGLRTHGLDAFVAPGPSDKMWRVVIGPLPNPEAFQRAKTKLDELGINTFGRKQQ
jgi:cell division septation protein DedD